MNDERISSSSSMGSILPSSVCRPSDIEEPHFLRVLLDELASRLDLVAHQHREDLVGRLDVFHRHELERARHGVHGGVPKLVGVHLAEPLEALRLGLGVAEVQSYEELRVEIVDLAKEGIQLQRFKGLGEMNPDQLWDTTMNPMTRTLQLVSMEDIQAADEVFTMLMGDKVEPRRAFIEKNAKEVRFLDV